MTRRPAAKKIASMTATWTPTPLAGANALVAQVYGLAGTVERLSSERDETFLFTQDCAARYILKIANPAEDPVALEFQDGALLHLERHAPSIPVPRLAKTRDGHVTHTLQTPDGPRIIRMLTYIEGELQYRVPPSPAQSYSLGVILASLGLGLEHYHGRIPAQKLMWDISHTLDLLDVVDQVDAQRRHHVQTVLAEFKSAAPTLAALKRRQIIHNDFNPHNILLDPDDSTRVVGVIDFGDMVHAPVVNDLAVALSYQLATEGWRARVGALLEGFASVRPLLREELELLPLLIRARLAMSVIIAEWRAARYPENRAYIMRNHPTAWCGLQNIATLQPGELARFAPNVFEA